MKIDNQFCSIWCEDLVEKQIETLFPLCSEMHRKKYPTHEMFVMKAYPSQRNRIIEFLVKEKVAYLD